MQGYWTCIMNVLCIAINYILLAIGTEDSDESEEYHAMCKAVSSLDTNIFYFPLLTQVKSVLL